MTIEEEVFQKQRPDFTKLTAAGFTKHKRDYQFEQDFMAGQLRAVVRVDFTGHVSGNVIDNGTGEEYLPLSSVHCGPFAAQVKTGYIDLLGEITRRCFVPEPFHGAQANRLSVWIQQEFHDQPEFVFKKLPDYAVFREPQPQKWYGLVMNISWAQLTGKTSASQDKVEVIDLRCPQEEQAAVLQLDDVYPGYHLNKKNWVCVLLEGTLTDEALHRLVLASRKTLTKPRSWLFPANPKYYDIMHAFAATDLLTWKQSARVRAGDTVFLYVSAPVKAIIYRCRVVKTDIPCDYRGANLKIDQVMQLQLEHRYDHAQFPLSLLRQYGVKSVQGPRHLPAALLEELDH